MPFIGSIESPLETHIAWCISSLCHDTAENFQSGIDLNDKQGYPVPCNDSPMVPMPMSTKAFVILTIQSLFIGFHFLIN